MATTEEGGTKEEVGQSKEETTTETAETEPETTKTETTLRGYAIYKYNSNRPTSPTQSTETENPKDPAEETVPEFLDKEATSNSDLSLSLLSSNLEPDQEAELRSFIGKRLSRGTVYSGIGNVSNLDAGTVAPVTCVTYYSLLRGSPSQDSTSTEAESYCATDFVVCFVTTFSTSLELFQSELDKYTKDLLPHIIKSLESSDVDEHFKNVKNWYDDNVLYVQRCVHLMKDDLSYIIQASLLGEGVTFAAVSEEDKTAQQYIQRFMDACSLSALLSTADNRSPNSGCVNGDLDEASTDLQKSDSPKIPSLCISIKESQVHFDSKIELSKFCEEWAKAMCSGDTENPVFLRQVIENYKLRAIQDMNTLKRMLRQAETEHYALYRSYLFLKKCGNTEVILKNIKSEFVGQQSSETQDIVYTLEEHLRDTQHALKSPS